MAQNNMADATTIVVEVWADLGCPWCYIGKHRHFADESGKGLGFFSQVQDRFFAGEINPWNAETLVEVAESLGLPGARVREVVSSDAYADRVRADVADGVSLGARGVPFTVFGRRLATPGALSVAAYNQALDQAVDALSTEGVNA
jgi:predicted DsbA family dithiol-disulfide isomerase